MNGIAFLAALSLSPAALVGGPRVAFAAPTPCTTSVTDYCVEDEIAIPGETPDGPDTPNTDARPVSVDPGPAGDEPACVWVGDPGPLAGGDGSPGAFPDVGSRPADDAYLIFERCNDELTGRVRWATPADPAPAGDPEAPSAVVPTPGQLAETIRVRLEGNLPQPVVATSPPTGEPAVVNHPTFLAIDNWTGTVTDQECAGPLCVTVTATPALAWTPGEPGVATLTCAGAGTTYDPTGAPPQDQAAQPGACAHAYEARTGVAGRPDAWPGTATVSWNLTWTSTTGADGPLPSITRSAPIPRAVDEVQAVVIH